MFFSREGNKSKLNDHSKFIYEFLLFLKNDYDGLVKKVEDTPMYLDFIKNELPPVIKEILIWKYGFYGNPVCILSPTGKKKHFLTQLAEAKTGISRHLENALICSIDVFKLIEALKNTQCKFAISEFDDEEVINTFKTHGLQLSVVAKSDCKAMLKKRSEILATNYDTGKIAIQEELF